MGFAQQAITAIIVSGASASAPIDGRSGSAFGLLIPSVFTGTSISYAVSTDGQSFVPLYDAANALVSQGVAPNRAYAVPAAVVSWPYWEVVSATAEAGPRTVIVVSKT